MNANSKSQAPPRKRPHPDIVQLESLFGSSLDALAVDAVEVLERFTFHSPDAASIAKTSAPLMYRLAMLDTMRRHSHERERTIAP